MKPNKHIKLLIISGIFLALFACKSSKGASGDAPGGTGNVAACVTPVMKQNCTLLGNPGEPICFTNRTIDDCLINGCFTCATNQFAQNEDALDDGDDGDGGTDDGSGSGDGGDSDDGLDIEAECEKEENKDKIVCRTEEVNAESPSTLDELCNGSPASTAPVTIENINKLCTCAGAGGTFAEICFDVHTICDVMIGSAQTMGDCFASIADDSSEEQSGDGDTSNAEEDPEEDDGAEGVPEDAPGVDSETQACIDSSGVDTEAAVGASTNSTANTNSLCNCLGANDDGITEADCLSVIAGCTGTLNSCFD